MLSSEMSIAVLAMKTAGIMLAIMIGLAAPVQAQESCGPVYRLYRTWPAGSWPPETDLPVRVHVATFDTCERAAGDIEYNASNCEIARDLFQNQPGVTAVYWCERVK